MKCQSCANEISENLKASIVSNFCPFCGKDILTAQQLYLKNVICQSILRSTAINPNLLNLQLPGTIDSLASGISADLALKVDSAGSAPLSSENHSTERVSVSEVGEDYSSIQAPEKGGKVAIPDHLKPKNKTPAKRLSRDGESLESGSVPKELSAGVDFDQLEQSLMDEGMSVDASSADTGILNDLSDSDFFVNDDEIVYGASKKADILKQKLKNTRDKGLIPKISLPVSRTS